MDDAHTTEIVTADGGLRTDPGLPPSAMIALENSMRSTKGAGRGPRSIARQLGMLTSVLVLAVVAAGGFLAGVKVQKDHAGTTTSGRVATAGATTGGGAAARAAAAGTTSTAAGGTASTAAGAAAAAGGGTGAGAAAGAAGAGRRGAGGAAGAAGATGAAGGTASTGAGAAPADTGATGTGAGGAAGRAGFAAGGGAVTAGQVKLVDGNNLYVTDAQGNVVKVTTSDASRFTRTGQAAITDIHPGDTIVVQGSKGADGIVSATAVADTGASATGGLIRPPPPLRSHPAVEGTTMQQEHIRDRLHEAMHRSPKVSEDELAEVTAVVLAIVTEVTAELALVIAELGARVEALEDAAATG